MGGRYNVNLYRGNVGTLSSNGASYDPNSNTWAMISNTNAPNARDYHTAIWIGSKMIIWGGSTDPNGPGNGLGATNTGKIYDPSTNTWANMSSLNAPASRGNATGIWTGSKFIVWGGCADPYVFANPLNSGGIYDPSNDTWISISNTNAPVAKNANIVIWTGSKMIVFGGVSTLSGGLLTSGAVYDPITDTWDNLTATGSPNNAVNGVWAGTKMLVWGSGTDGGIYDQSTYTWSKLEGNGTNSIGGKAIWTGSQMITNLGGSGGEIIGLSPFQLTTTKKLFLYKKD